MALSHRLIRRAIIFVVFLAVFFILGYGTRQLTQVAPVCTDGIQNGQEEGIDCGVLACGVECTPELEAPRVVSTKLIKAGDNDYDFVAEISNPNPDYGASEVAYELKLFNGNDEELLTRSGVFYILPGQDKFFIIPFLTTERNVSRAELDIKSVVWQQLDSLEGLNLLVKAREYSVSSNGRSSVLGATIINDSDFDFDTVDIDVVLRNSREEIVAVNRSEINTFVAGTERYFQVSWPFPISGGVSEIEIMPTTNLFKNSNYIKSYGSDIEQFQEY